MIYIAAIFFLVISHLIYRRGKRGQDVSERLEKIVVFFAAILSFCAIVKLGTSSTSLFVHEGDDLSGWGPEIFVYPAALIPFLAVVFVVLPKPIPRRKNAEDDADQPATAVDSKAE